MEFLVLSNGKGEDSIAVTLLKELENIFKQNNKELSIKTLPLIGSGSTYSNAGYNVLDTEKDLPSRGFSGINILSILKDIKSGLLGIAKKHINIIKESSKTANVIICIGDIYPVFLAHFFSRKQIFHVATAISASYHKYSLPETALLKGRCEMVFSRDPMTAEYLLSKGVKAKHLGNTMMDDPNILPTNMDLGISKSKKTIGLLPSGRDDAPENTFRFLEVIENINNPADFEFVLSIPPSFKFDALKKIIAGPNWTLQDEGKIIYKDSLTVKIIKGHFADIVKTSRIVMGTTGTGSEQAVGLGTPLVIIKIGTVNTSNARLNMYRKMLNDAVLIPKGDDKEVADQIINIINQPEKLKEMSEAGRRIMGEKGASKKIAQEIFNLCQA